MTEIPGTLTDVDGRPLDFGTSGNVKPAGGHCCRCLTLWWTFEDLAASYEAAKAGHQTFVRPATGQVAENVQDILTLGPMLRLVGVCSENPLTGDPFDEPRKVWRCIHQRDDFTCGIYETRPEMCRRYPWSSETKVCQYDHCGSTSCPGHRSNVKATL
jgi:Fe-S-cluster containining protein